MDEYMYVFIYTYMHNPEWPAGAVRCDAWPREHVGRFARPLRAPRLAGTFNLSFSC